MTAPALPRPAVGVRGGARLRVAAAAIAATAALAGTLALTHAPSIPHARVGTPALDPAGLVDGQTLQQARCSNWLHASAGDKAFAVRALAAIVGAPTEYRGVRGTSLTSAESYQLLNNACGNPIARNFLLYELYIRAAAFRSLATQQP